MSKDLTRLNGALPHCQLLEDHMSAILETHQKLEQLNICAPQFLAVVTEIRDHLMTSATGKNHIDKETFHEALDNVQENNANTLAAFHKVYWGIIGLLLIVISVLMVGQKFGVIPIPGK